MPRMMPRTYEDLGLCTCGGRIWADLETCAVMHSVPYCAAFRDLEPDKFLTYVRRSRGIPDSALSEK
jgi:hypothetical protein